MPLLTCLGLSALPVGAVAADLTWSRAGAAVFPNGSVYLQNVEVENGTSGAVR